MENAHLMLFICLAAPLSMMFFVFKERARILAGFLLTGFLMCLLAGEVNGLIFQETELSVPFISVNIAPIVEEFLKALPVVFLAFLWKPKKQLLLECAIAVGVGFATMENTCLLYDHGSSLSAWILLARGFGAGMMHGVSTFAVGYSMTVISHDRKLSYTGTVAALSAAIIYHSVYNILVQSEMPLLGILLPILTYIPLIVILYRQRAAGRA